MGKRIAGRVFGGDDASGTELGHGIGKVADRRVVGWRHRGDRLGGRALIAADEIARCLQWIAGGGQAGVNLGVAETLGFQGAAQIVA